MQRYVLILLCCISLTLKINAECANNYTVKAGDNCYRIGLANNLTVNQLRELNPNLNASCHIQPGYILCVGSADRDQSSISDTLTKFECTNNYTVKAGDNCYRIGLANNLTVNQLRELNPNLNASCQIQPGYILCVGNADGDQSSISDGIDGTNLTYVKSLDLGDVDFGFYTRNINLNEQSGCDNALEAVKTFYEISGPYNIPALRNYLQFPKSIRGIAQVIKVVVLLEVTGPVMDQIHNLKINIYKEFKRLRNKGLSSLEYQLNVYGIDEKKPNFSTIDYEKNVRDPIFSLLKYLDNLLKFTSVENLQTFMELCIFSSPTSLLQKIFDIISDRNFGLNSLIEQIGYSEKIYNLLQGAFFDHLSYLKIILGHCEAFTNNSTNNNINDFDQIQEHVISETERGMQFLKTTYWPNSVKNLAREKIDESGTNRQIAEKINYQLNFHHEDDFFVMISEEITGPENIYINGTPDHVLYEWSYKNKTYVIFRNTCKKPQMRERIKNRIYNDKTTDPKGLGASRALGKKLGRQIGQDSSMILIVKESNYTKFDYAFCIVYFVKNNGNGLTYVIGLN